MGHTPYQLQTQEQTATVYIYYIYIIHTYIHTLTLRARAGTGSVGAGHRVSRPRGTGSVGDSVGEGGHTHKNTKKRGCSAAY